MSSKTNLTIGTVAIHVPGTVLKKLNFKGIWLIIVDVNTGLIEDLEQNVRAYSDNGKFLWKIQAIPRDPGLKDGIIDRFADFIGEKHGKVLLESFREGKYLVDIETGDLYRTDNVKLPRVKFATELLELQKKGLFPK